MSKPLGTYTDPVFDRLHNISPPPRTSDALSETLMRALPQLRGHVHYVNGQPWCDGINHTTQCDPRYTATAFAPEGPWLAVVNPADFMDWCSGCGERLRKGDKVRRATGGYGYLCETCGNTATCEKRQD